MTVSVSLQQMRTRTARRYLTIFILCFVLYTIMNFEMGKVFMLNQRADLSSSGWILIPNQTNGVVEPDLEAKIISGQCQPNDTSCGSWRNAAKLDFTKFVPKTISTVYLVSNVGLSEMLAQAQTDAREKISEHEKAFLGTEAAKSTVVVFFNDAYADLTAYVNGEKIGFTSRHLPMFAKPFFFANTEAIPVPATIPERKGDTDLVVVRAARFKDVSLPLVYRLGAFSIMDTVKFVRSEGIVLVTLLACVMAVLFLGVYHLLIWFLRRNDWSSLAFSVFAILICSQNFFYYNIASYFGISPEVIWRGRMVLVHNVIAPYLAMAVFAGFPPSYFYVHRRQRSQGIRDTIFSTFGPFRKLISVVGEFLYLLVHPSVAILCLFLPISTANTIVYKYSVPMTIPLSIGFAVAVARWFYFTAKQRNISFLLPLVLAVAIYLGGQVSGFANALGVRQFSGLAAGYSMAVFTVLFAVSIGNQFSYLHHRLSRLKTRLDKILIGTRELAATHDVISASVKTANYLYSESLIPSDAKGTFVLLQDDGAESMLVNMSVSGTSGAFEENKTVPPRKAVFLEESRDSQESYLSSKGEFVVPVVLDGKRLGVLHFDHFSASEIHRDDAIFANTLSSSLATSLANIQYLQETAQKARLEAELVAAHAVQKSLIPTAQSLINLDIVTYYEAASQTGGDWFGYHVHANKRWVDFYVGDVTGHGIPAALLTGVVCGSIRTSEILIDSMEGAEEYQNTALRLQKLAKVVNSMVRSTGQGHLMMTMAFFSVDMETGDFVYLNAAHTPILWAQQKEDRVTVLGLMGHRLGYIDSPEFKIKTGTLRPGDRLLIYTDGLIENRGPDGKLFSERELRNVMAAHSEPESLKEGVLAAARAVWKEQPADDDITFVIFRWKGPEAKRPLETSAVSCDSAT